MYKNTNNIFFVIFKILLKFQELSCGKIKWNLFGEYIFCIILKIVFWDLSFYFCLKVHKLDDSFTLIWKKILCAIVFYFYVIFCHLDPMAWIANYSKWVSFGSFKISFMSSGDKPILTLKISVKLFADFDILQILL